MAGPLRNLGLGLSDNSFQTLTLLMAGSYLLVLLATRALPMWAIAFAIVAAHIILLLGPPLISQDVFGYLGFARLGALHGLDPYTNFPVRIFTDPVIPFGLALPALALRTALHARQLCDRTAGHSGGPVGAEGSSRTCKPRCDSACWARRFSAGPFAALGLSLFWGSIRCFWSLPWEELTTTLLVMLLLSLALALTATTATAASSRGQTSKTDRDIPPSAAQPPTTTSPPLRSSQR